METVIVFQRLRLRRCPDYVDPMQQRSVTRANKARWPIYQIWWSDVRSLFLFQNLRLYKAAPQTRKILKFGAKKVNHVNLAILAIKSRAALQPKHKIWKIGGTQKNISVLDISTKKFLAAALPKFWILIRMVFRSGWFFPIFNFWDLGSAAAQTQNLKNRRYPNWQ